MPFITPVESLALHPSGWFKLTPTLEVTCAPVLDSHFAIDQGCGDGPRMFAHPLQPTIEVWARSFGARLIRRSTVMLLRETTSKLGTELHPVILPDAEQVKEFTRQWGPCPKKETNPKGFASWQAKIRAPMGSLEWCRRHDARVHAQVQERGGWVDGKPWSNIGKHPTSDHSPGRMRICGWWDGQWIQAGTADQHGEDQVDYATLYMLERDVGGVPEVTTNKLDTKAADDLYRPTKGTRASAGEVYAALKAAWLLVLKDTGATDAVLTILTAQSGFETAGWSKCWNWNLGNVRRRPGKPWLRLRKVLEYGPDGKPVVYDDAGYGTQFSAFDDLESAAVAWLEFLRDHYTDAVSQLIATESAETYCAALVARKGREYFSAPLKSYTAGVVAWVKQVRDSMLDVPAALAELGYSDVKSFQRAHPPLVADGIAGPKTKAALRDALTKR